MNLTEFLLFGNVLWLVGYVVGGLLCYRWGFMDGLRRSRREYREREGYR